SLVEQHSLVARLFAATDDVELGVRNAPTDEREDANQEVEAARFYESAEIQDGRFRRGNQQALHGLEARFGAELDAHGHRGHLFPGYPLLGDVAAHLLTLHECVVRERQQDAIQEESESPAPDSVKERIAGDPR